MSSLCGGQTAPTFRVAPTRVLHGQGRLQVGGDLSSTGCTLREDHCPGARGVRWIRRPWRSPTPLQEAAVWRWQWVVLSLAEPTPGPCRVGSVLKVMSHNGDILFSFAYSGHYKSYLIFFMSLLAAGVCTPSSTDAMAMMGPCQWGSSRSRQSVESSSSHLTSQGS